MTWRGEPEPGPGPVLGLAGWACALGRGIPVAIATFGGLGVLLLVRVVERPLFGQRRPWTPWLVLGVCRFALRVIGFRREVRGQPMRAGGAVVANHTSWLDIFALNSVQRVRFVAKTEVRGWAGIGWLARATDTVFIRRNPRESAAQAALLHARLQSGQQLLLFPEGTSTDGRRVLPFKSTLFAAFDAADPTVQVQPVSVIWHPPPGAAAGYYGWWGEMEFASNLLKILATPHQGRVELIYHPPLQVAAYPDRKALALALERAVRSGHAAAMARDP